MKHSIVKRWMNNWGFMGGRQMSFDDKMSKLNHISREPLLIPMIYIQWLNVANNLDVEVSCIAQMLKVYKRYP